MENNNNINLINTRDILLTIGGELVSIKSKLEYCRVSLLMCDNIDNKEIEKAVQDLTFGVIYVKEYVNRCLDIIINTQFNNNV